MSWLTWWRTRSISHQSQNFIYPKCHTRWKHLFQLKRPLPLSLYINSFGLGFGFLLDWGEGNHSSQGIFNKSSRTQFLYKKIQTKLFATGWSHHSCHIFPCSSKHRTIRAQVSQIIFQYCIQESTILRMEACISSNSHHLSWFSNQHSSPDLFFFNCNHFLD